MELPLTEYTIKFRIVTSEACLQLDPQDYIPKAGELDADDYFPASYNVEAMGFDAAVAAFRHYVAKAGVKHYEILSVVSELD